MVKDIGRKLMLTLKAKEIEIVDAEKALFSD